MSKRIVVLSDLHCGSLVGLTPKPWQVKEGRGEKLNKFAELQKVAYDWYLNELKSLGKIDICFCLGDCVDGADKKGAGAFQITTDLEEQAEIAIDALRMVKAKDYIFVYGSGYHVTAEGLDIENLIAKTLAGKIGNHEFVDVNGVIFNLKHKCGRSSIPHGPYTLLAKQKLWETLWAERKQFPISNILIRGHVHYGTFCGNPDFLAITCPCLKTLGDKFGGRNFIDIIDYGLIHFDVYDNGAYSWMFHIANFERQKQKIRRL